MKEQLVFYFYDNGRSAAAIANYSDILELQTTGLNVLAENANKGDKHSQAVIQRCVNSKLLEEGNY